MGARPAVAVPLAVRLASLATRRLRTAVGHKVVRALEVSELGTISQRVQCAADGLVSAFSMKSGKSLAVSLP